MKNRDAYEQKAKAKLDEWEADIDKLKAKAKQTDAEARIELNEEIDAATAKKEIAAEKLARLQDASEQSWGDLKAGVDVAWASLDQAVKSAKARFDSAV